MPPPRSETLVTLPRELVDLSEQVRQAPAPAAPKLPPPYSLRLVDPEGDDPELIAAWMARPHLAATWEQSWPAERWRADSRARLSGAYSRPYLLDYDMADAGRPEDGVRPVGYIEYYRVAKDECARCYPADPWDVGFHIATGETELIGRGIMSRWIGVMAAEVFAAEPYCRRLICDPDHRNAPMRRALEKCGWILLGEHQVRPERRIALYCLPRTPEDLPRLAEGD
ncbi:GNAT family N-acetyltransferase [Segniliparus rugosus]|uniref:Lysine N-acyltransferase MbtK n=1 Tax=Segniliparus rugosus (strain ATCC BAA-974 / DSM 45345 / CCUG 50838 / CIP 108380 / JCM 13579 / CDC 945) TaxID=679197 RepID=E5XLS3_SEGRC|nr:GNAT family N-acetyltransferase [Segniliparus rugosus]EFV14751.1 hypothetical protein HMPREF9336_00442 [Segniliparus rugosus ATCC BAA-974]